MVKVSNFEVTVDNVDVKVMFSSITFNNVADSQLGGGHGGRALRLSFIIKLHQNFHKMFKKVTAKMA